MMVDGEAHVVGARRDEEHGGGLQRAREPARRVEVDRAREERDHEAYIAVGTR